MADIGNPIHGSGGVFGVVQSRDEAMIQVSQP
jgi:hypothetical protein